MTNVGDVLHLHNDHEKAQLLLPWYVNGTLEPEETAMVEAHLAGCGECRQELAAERALRDLYADTPPLGQPGRPVALEPSDSSARRLVRRLTSDWSTATQIALAAAAAIALIVAVAPPDSREGFQLLGSGEVSGQANAIVLFSPDTAERDLRAALEQAGARLVDGPTASGAYVVQIPEERRAQALAGLRALPQVILAEPVDPTDRP
jgi:anti-sigma factor RsiW